MAVVALAFVCRRHGLDGELMLLATPILGLPSHDADGADAARDWQQALIDTIPALAWSARPDGARDYHNPQWLAFTGLTEAQAMGDGWADALHPEDRAQVLARWRAAVARGEPFEAEARGRNANGDYRWFLTRAAPLRDAHGTIIRWYGVNTDIEDRKRAHADLREREEQWREVFEHNPVMYFMVDADGTVLSVNGFGAAQLGYTVEELVGQSVLGVFFEEDRDFVRSNLDLCIDYPGNAHGWEVRKIRKDGRVLWVRENAKAVRRADKVIVLIACEDITERKRADEQLNLARAELAHMSRVTTVGELTAAIAHEVNQPLTGLVTSGHAALRWLAADPANVAAAQRAVERMINDGNRAGEVIARIRAMVKKAPPRRDRLDLNEMLSEVISLIRGELQRNDIVLRTALARPLPSVIGDRVQLQQVVLNLHLNAIEAMSSVHDRRRELVVATEMETPDGILVSVRDSGPGLDESVIDRLFEPFYTTKPEGMGMGLAISRTIIEAHGGELGARRNDGHGATFWFRLPSDAGPPQ